MLNGDDGNDADDHDTRKLPTKRRMEIVMKNKAEANELFGDGNYKHACARYAKALSHCNKFFDLSPDDEVEVSYVLFAGFSLPIFASLTKNVQQLQVKEVKLSLHINMALSYIKLEKLDNAFQSCNEALAIDPKNVKALYRRATVQHNRRKFDDALNDLKQAEELAPDDKAVKKLKRLVDHEMLKQKKKEQAMAKKCLGSVKHL
jgi:tetratricopeptide (TPR) repeat protein